MPSLRPSKAAAMRRVAACLALGLLVAASARADADTRKGCDRVSDLRRAIHQIDRAVAAPRAVGPSLAHVQRRLAGIGEALERAGETGPMEMRLLRIVAGLRTALSRSGPEAAAAVRHEARSLSRLSVGLACDAPARTEGTGTVSDAALRPGQRSPGRIGHVPPALAPVRAAFAALPPGGTHATAAALVGAVVSLGILLRVLGKRRAGHRPSPSATEADRRRSPRYGCDVPCHVATGARQLAGIVETSCRNVSREGCGLMVWDAAAKGQACEIFVAGRWRAATVMWRGQNLAGLAFAELLAEDDIETILAESRQAA